MRWSLGSERSAMHHHSPMLGIGWGSRNSCMRVCMYGCRYGWMDAVAGYS